MVVLVLDASLVVGYGCQSSQSSPVQEDDAKTAQKAKQSKATMTTPTPGDQEADSIAPAADTGDTPPPAKEVAGPTSDIDADQPSDGGEEAPDNNADGNSTNDGAPADDSSPPDEIDTKSSQEAAEEARIRAEKFLEEKAASDTAASVTASARPAAGRSHSDTAISPESPSAPKVAVTVRSSSDANGLGHETEVVKDASPLRPSPTNSSVGLSTVQAALAAADAAEKNNKNADGSSNISPIFGPAIGTVVAKHLCKHEGKNGTLYLATRAVCFHSTLFGFEQARRVVPLATVVAILHMNENGIIIRDESGKTFHFIFQADRDACFNLLLNLHGRVSVYKLNRDQLKELGGESAEGEGENEVKGNDKQPDSSSTNEALLPRSLSTPVPKSSGKEEGDVAGEKDASEETYLAACAVANMADDETQGKRRLVDEISKGKISESGWKTAKKYGASDATLKTSDELRADWMRQRDSKTPTYEETVIDGFRLACTLDEYFDMFLSNDSEQHSYGSYQRKLGDSELDVSPWQLSEKDGMSLCRIVSYVHPVNAPMAPPSAAASKTQTFRRWGEHGMCIETRTEVKDVPMTDCFHVDDQILIEPTPDGGVSITGRFEIRFIKRTMFRSIITNTTKGEFVSWFSGYKMMLIDALKGRSVGDGTKEMAKEESVEVQLASEAQRRRSTLMSTAMSADAASSVSAKSEMYLLILLILVAILVLLQWTMMIQMRATNKAYLEISANQDRMYEMLSQMLEAAATSGDSSCGGHTSAGLTSTFTGGMDA